MKLTSRMALALGALAFLPLTPVHAADYDPPIYVDQAPDYVPVEVGSGWYLRGDIGYAFSHPFEHEETSSGPLNSFTSDSSLFTGSIGMGYHVNDYLRVELNGGILPTNKFSDHQNLATTCGGSTLVDDGFGTINSVAATQACDLINNGTNKGYSLMANGYVDLGTYVGITPYLGGGIGVAYNKYYRSIGARDCKESPVNSAGTGGFFCDDPAGYEGQTDTEAKFNLAYSIGAGLSYQVSKNLSVDLGYEYFSVPSAKYVAYDDGAFNIHKGIDYQTVKLGLRYDLW
ncbi:MAG: P44/Msp2 family outer membrane protein [Mesorhizobium sp.]|uniref:outer membrane protein n=1 Tax=Mesorhizobium sp. M7A.F.Ca.MR.176.00.0.0 TaxID=2496776 RepID=UPI000FD1F793|nr:outer membrane beta-barrel protein [Mesorhizobium sp. M7A.F.Ca.MR.176.00.0.0]RUU88441.1 porin family protein [Mesorhizobium sp. M7A.F.Ca.MR.176.00.0.0]RWN23213.1 MAG: porin family protein [Mesorhizobium sp.]TIM23400.1 MAG: P44/Msp2 family outer membrane protein [Mesorhizobium sp.]